MARPKRLPKDAEQVAVYLTPEEQMTLEAIRMRRKKRGEDRTHTSEIIADALWYTLEHRERMSNKQVRAFFADIVGKK